MNLKTINKKLFKKILQKKEKLNLGFSVSLPKNCTKHTSTSTKKAYSEDEQQQTNRKNEFEDNPDNGKYINI